MAPAGRHDAATAAAFAELASRFGALLADYDDGQLELMTAFPARLIHAAYELAKSLDGNAGR